MIVIIIIIIIVIVIIQIQIIIVLLQVQKHRQHLFNYMIFVRIMPFIPNWLINVTAPVINIPLLTFYFGTFFGKVHNITGDWYMC